MYLSFKESRQLLLYVLCTEFEYWNNKSLVFKIKFSVNRIGNKLSKLHKNKFSF